MGCPKLAESRATISRLWSFTRPDGRTYCLFEDGEQIAATLAAHHIEMPGTSRQRLEAIAGAILEATSPDEEPPLVFYDYDSLEAAWAELQRLHEQEGQGWVM